MEKNSTLNMLSLDSIYSQLTSIPEPFDEVDEKNVELIALVLQKLPLNVAQKVLTEVQFIIIDGAIGRHELISCQSHDELKLTFTIFLNFLGINRLKKIENRHTVIAHEIAHFYLKHNDNNGGAEEEREADDLCEKWGFGRAYRTYKGL